MSDVELVIAEIEKALLEWPSRAAMAHYNEETQASFIAMRVLTVLSKNAALPVLNGEINALVEEAGKGLKEFAYGPGSSMVAKFTRLCSKLAEPTPEQISRALERMAEYDPEGAALFRKPQP